MIELQIELMALTHLREAWEGGRLKETDAASAADGQPIVDLAAALRRAISRADEADAKPRELKRW